MNNKKNIFILSAVFLLLISCKTNPPIAPPLPESGQVFITANITGAQIFLDNNNTGKNTPDTIETTIGLHEVRLEKENYLSSAQNVEVLNDSIVELTFTLALATGNKIVLLEDFANVSCNPCVNSNKIIKALTDVTYGPTKT